MEGENHPIIKAHQKHFHYPTARLIGDLRLWERLNWLLNWTVFFDGKYNVSFLRRGGRLSTEPTRKENRCLTPVCFAYLNELVILSNGDVTTCCLDAKGINKLGNVMEMPLEKLWQERFLPWHERNVEANLRGAAWDSILCKMCLEYNCMSAFDAKYTGDSKLIEGFHQLSHPFPVSLVIEPASVCNYSCCGCYAGLNELNRKGFLDMDSFNQKILPVISKVKRVRLYNYGESFLHPRIVNIIKSLRLENPTLCLDISTNGMLMDHAIAEAVVEGRVNYLIVSLHGGHTQAGLIKYSRIGPEINVIQSNIEYLVKLKRSKGNKLPWIFLKAILFHWNDSEEEMGEFLKFGNALGVDFVGWGMNNSDPTLSSKRVAPGTQPYQLLVEKRLLESNFYELPAWPFE